MKYLHLFENYKDSVKYGDKISDWKFKQLYKKHCKLHKKPLYRGIGYGFNVDDLSEYYYLNPKGHFRRSIENKNIHLIIMSEDEKWKDFPPYNQTVIGSTTKGGYGIQVEVIPFDNTRIGICPDKDVWTSFGGYDDDDPIKLIDNFLKEWIDYSGKESWEHIKHEILNTNVKEKFEKYYKIQHQFYSKKMSNFFASVKRFNEGKNFIAHSFDHIEEVWEYTPKLIKAEDILKFIESIFIPEGFTVLKYDENFTNKLENLYKDFMTNKLQYWCEGPVLLKRIK